MPTKAKSSTKKKTAKKNNSSFLTKDFTKRKKILLITIAIALFAAIASYFVFRSYALESQYPRVEAAIYQEINQVRRNHGLRPLTPTICMHDRAFAWAKYLKRTGKFEHQDLSRVLEKCPNGDKPNYAAETLFGGLPAEPIRAREVVNGWMNSDGHRKILLSTKPNSLGIGVVTRANGDMVVVANFSAECGNACGNPYQP